ncbi:MAG: amidohydrolase [Deltaproteobacteria bacterium]|nr:amidohydrolase [Candidatus Anaeroferrophillus wilburensis]MBN2889819.1 amidohydrolase [Deltaproteobacteria bacterium]
MDIIDIHLHVGHVFEWSPAAVHLWMNTGPYRQQIYNDDGVLVPEQYHRVLAAEGIVGGVLLPEYSPETAGVLPVEGTFAISSRFPQYLPFGAVNPLVHDDVVAEFERQLALGVQGLKIHGVHGLFPVNDRRLYPLYELCVARSLPVMFHAGTSVFPKTKLKHADPYLYDEVAADFSDLTMILCHGGRGFWYQLAEFMLIRHANVHIDISGLPPQNLLTYYPKMERLADKFLFGSDFPGVPGLRRNVEKMEQLGLSRPALAQICYHNAVRIMPFGHRITQT